ncbi:hypothetical protein TWF696_007898 [Orbilia brochopaga]|uniref:Uncharacterized protein n=1 Tax=Orbilia brochopaga TaxID=3140254 RepID=A0AAV9USP5_9PEZI
MERANNPVIDQCEYILASDWKKCPDGKKPDPFFTGKEALVCHIVKRETCQLTVTMEPFKRRVAMAADRIRPDIPDYVSAEKLVDYVWDTK